MREFNAIFPEIKYDLRKCLECDDIFTPAYRHPHQKFCKNPKFPIKILIIHQSAFFVIVPNFVMKEAGFAFQDRVSSLSSPHRMQ